VFLTCSVFTFYVLYVVFYRFILSYTIICVHAAFYGVINDNNNNNNNNNNNKGQRWIRKASEPERPGVASDGEGGHLGNEGAARPAQN